MEFILLDTFFMLLKAIGAVAGIVLTLGIGYFLGTLVIKGKNNEKD